MKGGKFMKSLIISLVTLFGISALAQNECNFVYKNGLDKNPSVNSQLTRDMTCADVLYTIKSNAKRDGDLGEVNIGDVKIIAHTVVAHEANVLAYQITVKYMTGHGSPATKEWIYSMYPGGDSSLRRPRN